MQLDTMLERGKRLEERAAMLYRSYAAASRNQPSLCALWTSLAREEEDHARSIVTARDRLEATAGWRTWLDGWDAALTEVDERLTAAEQLGPEATVTRQLSTALELEMSELDGFRRVLLAACRQPESDPPADHALRLADAAEELSDDPQVRLQAALLKARTRLNRTA
jgi:hypothetical protein